MSRLGSTDSKGVATPIAEMERLIEENPRNQTVIFPYIGGREVNTSPTQSHHRYVINFGESPLCREGSLGSWAEFNRQERTQCLRRGRVPSDYPDAVAADWPELLAIVEHKVKPDRIRKDGNKYPRMVHEWWKYWNSRQELHAAIEGLKIVLAINCGATPHAAFTFLPSKMVFANTLAIFPFHTYTAFCTLQSRVHEIWARFFGSSLEDRLRYTPSDCFETFPFPERWEMHPVLETAGTAYYKYRAALMVRNDEGMTKTYNRFHDPYENDAGITKLRDLHAAMDRAVLDAYGWTDIPVACEFFLEYDIDETTWGRKKKPYRYRWPDPVRNEVLSRLLAVNAKRAAEESRSGGVPAHGRSSAKTASASTKPTPLYRT